MESKFIDYKINSSFLNREVKVTIRLPYGYSDEGDTFNVLYIHDGKNAFFDEKSYNGKAWGFDETLKDLERENLIEKTVAVAFYCNEENEGLERFREYFIGEDRTILLEDEFLKYKEIYKDGVLYSKGHNHMGFLIGELLEKVESNFNIGKDRKKRAIIGSSMGGYISTIIGVMYQNLFSKAYCISNAYFYDLNAVFKFIKGIQKTHDIKFYLDVGDCESDLLSVCDKYIYSNKSVNKLLKELGYETVFNLIKNGEHTEQAWSNRLKDILLMNKIS